MPQVDLELAATVLVRGGDRAELELDRGVEHPRERPLRVGHLADRVNGAVLPGVWAPSTRIRGVRFQQVELELRPDHRRYPELGELGQHPLQHPAAVERMRLVGDRVLEVDQAGDDVLLPGQRHERVQIRAGEEIRKAALEARDHVVAQVDGHDRLDEPHPFLGEVREGRDRDQLAAADAVQVGVLEAHRADADVGQLGQAADQPRPRRGLALLALVRPRVRGAIAEICGPSVLSSSCDRRAARGGRECERTGVDDRGATVGREHRAVHVRRGGRGQPRHAPRPPLPAFRRAARARGKTRFAYAASRSTPCISAELIHRRVCHRGAHPSGADAVGADAGRTVVERDALGEHDQPGLR